jgi:NAD(P)-dependent dehydrogenase (short-subunit alcohol dehydrogenase family)
VVTGKTVIVTGGAKGIGRYIASTFAKAGARVVIADIDTDRLHDTFGELQSTGAEAMAVETDVRDETQVRSLMEQVSAHFGGIDVLVNNAGVVPHFLWGVNKWPAIQDMDLSFWDRVIETNLKGTFLCSKHAIPYMERRRGGHILNLHGGGNPLTIGTCSYAVTKDAIWTFTKHVAEEVREAGIMMAILSPGGAIATEDAPEEARQRMPGPELAEERFVLAAQAGLEMSGHRLDIKDGALVIDD